MEEVRMERNKMGKIGLFVSGVNRRAEEESVKGEIKREN
jgi:hypothetical protein